MSARGAPPQCPEVAFRSSWDDGLRVALLRLGVWGHGEKGALSGPWATGRRAAKYGALLHCAGPWAAFGGSLRRGAACVLQRSGE